MEDFYLIVDKITETYKEYVTGVAISKTSDKVFQLLPFIILLIFIYLMLKR